MIKIPIHGKVTFMSRSHEGQGSKYAEDRIKNNVPDTPSLFRDSPVRKQFLLCTLINCSSDLQN